MVQLRVLPFLIYRVRISGTNREACIIRASFLDPIAILGAIAESLLRPSLFL